MNYSKFISFGLLLILLTVISGCDLTKSNNGANNSPPIRIGVMMGPMTDIANVVAEDGKKEGLNIQILTYSNFDKLNHDLENGLLDLNNYQSSTFLANYNDEHHTKLVPLSRTALFRLGIYSKKVHTLDTIPQNATVVIPKDKANSVRALHLLEAAGLIQLHKTDGLNVTAENIIYNPHNLAIKNDYTPDLPQLLEESDLAVIPLSVVMYSGLNLEKYGLYLEAKDAPDAGIYLVSRDVDKENPDFQKIIRLFHSDAVKEFVLDTYIGTIVIPD